jgi:hypothetical protein
MGTAGSAVSAGTQYTLANNSTANFSADFGAGTVSTSLNLAGAPGSNPAGQVANFGSFTGSGAINSGGPGFSGTLTGNGANGVFSGGFFGPQAAEVGFGWQLNGSGFSAVGLAGGTKQ